MISPKTLKAARQKLERINEARLHATIASQGLSLMVDRPEVKKVIAEAATWCTANHVDAERVWGVNTKMLCMPIGWWAHLDPDFADQLYSDGWTHDQSIVAETIKQSSWDSANGLCISKCS
ncbi:hypothetical protein ENKOMM257B_06930 [Enterobacter kobei]|uniref:hypothetical protein n=2 Tax=Enterobacter kobei TaxID=208224 RepID=UPI003B25D708